jgi:hypothetical protein
MYGRFNAAANKFNGLQRTNSRKWNRSFCIKKIYAPLQEKKCNDFSRTWRGRNRIGARLGHGMCCASSPAPFPGKRSIPFPSYRAKVSCRHCHLLRINISTLKHYSLRSCSASLVGKWIHRTSIMLTFLPCTSWQDSGSFFSLQNIVNSISEIKEKAKETEMCNFVTMKQQSIHQHPHGDHFLQGIKLIHTPQGGYTEKISNTQQQRINLLTLRSIKMQDKFPRYIGMISQQ